MTQEDVPSSSLEPDISDQLVLNDPNEVEVDNAETVVQPVTESNDDEVSTSSSEGEEPKDTTIKKPPEVDKSSESYREEPDPGFIPNVSTPSLPWTYPPRPRSTGHTPDKDPNPLTPRDPFKDSTGQHPSVPKTPIQTPIPVVQHTPVQ